MDSDRSYRGIFNEYTMLTRSTEVAIYPETYLNIFSKSDTNKATDRPIDLVAHIFLSLMVVYQTLNERESPKSEKRKLKYEYS